MSKDQFLDRVMECVKYKGVHKYICEELSAHIEEAEEIYEKDGFDRETALQMAVEALGDAEVVGNAFNREYRMPFNSRHGLTIWSGTAVCFIYFLLYPLTVMLSNGEIQAVAPTLIITVILILFALANYLVLRRGHFISSVRDVRDIIIGFFCGAVISLIVLFGLSALDEFGYYPYADGVAILFMRPVYYLGSEIRLFGDEFFILLFCMTIYMVSCKVNTKARGFEFVVGLGDSVYPHYVDFTE